MKIIYKKKFRKNLKKVPKKFWGNVIERIDEFEKTPFPRGKKFKKLAKKDDEFRLRVGEYRIFYSVDFENEMVLIRDIFHGHDGY